MNSVKPPPREAGLENVSDELSRQIIETSRRFRMGSTTMDEWTARINRMLHAQPDIQCPFEVQNVRAPQGIAGASNGTLFLEIEFRRPDGTVTLPYVFRFAPVEQLFHVYDFDGQVRIQRSLREAGIPIPAQCWEDIKGRYLGTPGYIMERGSGRAAPGAWIKEGVIAEALPDMRRRLVMSFVETLAQIHAVDWRRWGLSFLLDRAEGDGLIEREVNWYWDGVNWAGEQEAIDRLGNVREWLIANQPPITRPTLCHGDSNFTNCLFDGDHVSAMLDWEMAFIGTPQCDLTYLMVAMGALSPTYPEGVPTNEEMIAQYERITGVPLTDVDYYMVFTRFRLMMTLFLGMRTKVNLPDDARAAHRQRLDAMVEETIRLARSLGMS